MRAQRLDPAGRAAGGPWSIRLAEPGDLPILSALEAELFPTDAWSPAMMAAELAAEGSHYLVACDENGAVAGYAGLRAFAGSSDGDVQTLAVVPAARRHGLGRRLLGALLEEAADRRVRAVFLEVRADNPGAQALYRSTGFEEIGVRPHYYQPDDVDALIMRLELGARS